MHETAYNLMRGMVQRHVTPRFPNGGRVLDVGSLSVEGQEITHRSLFGDGWTYRGLDKRSGANVDFVADVLDRSIRGFEVVISGQMLEHCERPWDAVKSMAASLNSGGVLLLVAPFLWHYHEHPVDYWRFTGEGLGQLCRLAGLEVLECGQQPIKPHRADAWCAAVKA